MKAALLFVAVLSSVSTLVAQSPPGTLVDIGGQRLHLHCGGTGAPTVVLEGGAGDFSFIWALVQPEVQKFTRVCSYDRAGYAWSDPGRQPRTFGQLALELHTALERAGEAGPYVLVGQSFGGLVVRGFAAQYRSEVQGMVLVDAVHEDQRVIYGGQPHRIRDGATGRPFPEPEIALDTLTLRLVRDSVARRSDEPLDSPLDRLPPAQQRLWRWAESQPVFRMTQPREMEWSGEELARMHTQRERDRATLGNIPLIVLARTEGGYASGMSISADSLERERRSFAADLAKLSTRGQFIFAERSGHNIHLEDPALVVRAIRTVVESAR